MPTFELSDASGTYHIDAPDEGSALSALQSMNGAKSSVGMGEDLAKSAATVPGRAVASVAGLPGDLYHLGLRALGDNLTPESRFGSNSIREALGSNYQAQSEPGVLLQKAADFAPAMIGGPETLLAKAATRVAAPVVASEIGKQVAGPYGELAGALVGAGGATAAARKFQEMAAARNAGSTVPAAEEILKTAKSQFKSAEDMNLVVSPEFAADAAAKMRADLKGFDPEAQSVVFKAADRLEALAPKERAAIADADALRQKYGDAVANAFERQTAPKAQGSPDSLLQFIARKGGLAPDPELEAIGLAHGHRAQIPGQPGFFGVVTSKGTNIDRMREAAEEAGYIQGANNATATPRDLLDAIDAELRGRKIYPQGFEGFKNKRELSAVSARDQHIIDSHSRGLENDLANAGYTELGPDVKARAMKLMADEGLDADRAVESALVQLEHEDSVAGTASKPAFAAGFPPDMAKGVAMNDVELIRKQLTNMKTSPDASVREAARRAIKSLQESQLAINSEHVLNGDAAKYSKTMRDAIGNYAAGKRSNVVMGKVALGDLNAATAGSGSNGDNALRQAIKQLVRPVNNDIVPKAQRLGFNQHEIDAMNRVARGTMAGNTARYLGKGAPTGIVSAAGGLGIGHMAGGPVGAIALPAASYVAKKIGDLSTKKAVSALDSLVRSRSPLAAQVAAQLPPQIVRQLPSRTQRILQGLITATPAIRQQVGQAIGQPVTQ